MSNHAIEDYFTSKEAQQVHQAAAMARVMGSTGHTDRTERRGDDGNLVVVEETSVKAIEVNQRFGPAYQVTTHQGMVIVLASPGRYTSHAVSA